MKILVKLFKLLIFIVEKLSSEFALIAALLSLAVQGSYDDRIIGGMQRIFMALYGFGHAIAKDVNFDIFMTGFSASVQNCIATISENIKKDPQSALVGLVVTYISYKLLALVLRLFRKKLLRPRKRDKGPPESRQDGKGRTFGKLYEGV